MTIVFRWLGLSQPSQLPVADLIKFVIFSNLSIVGMNVSLMWNSVGFYQVSEFFCTCYYYMSSNCYQLNSFYFLPQIAKLCMIPASCLLEVVFDHVHYSRDTKLFEHHGCAYRSGSLHCYWCQCECKRSNCSCYSCLEHGFATICKLVWWFVICQLMIKIASKTDCLLLFTTTCKFFCMLLTVSKD